jgi:hypothetical protein
MRTPRQRNLRRNKCFGICGLFVENYLNFCEDYGFGLSFKAQCMKLENEEQSPPQSNISVKIIVF